MKKQPPPPAPTVVLERFLNRMEAHAARCLLEAHGLPVSVDEPALLGALGEIPFVEAPIRLLLHDTTRRREAATLLRKYRQGRLQGIRGVVWRCAGCGEVHEPEFTSCWNCGAEQP